MLPVLWFSAHQGSISDTLLPTVCEESWWLWQLSTYSYAIFCCITLYSHCFCCIFRETHAHCQTLERKLCMLDNTCPMLLCSPLRWLMLKPWISILFPRAYMPHIHDCLPFQFWSGVFGVRCSFFPRFSKAEHSVSSPFKREQTIALCTWNTLSTGKYVNWTYVNIFLWA